MNKTESERKNSSKSNIALFTMLIFLFALGFRLIGLGSASLTMNEAENALTALHLFEKGGNGQLLYTLPTAVIFRFFGSSEFTARLFPAAMGSVLVLIPAALRRKIGKSKALLLSLLFAVDPVLLFWSHRADAVIPAVTLAGAVFAFWLNGRTVAAIACLLIGSCGGARWWPFLILFCVGAALYHLIPGNERTFSSQRQLRKGDILIGILIFCLFCTAFGTFPGGFGCFAKGFTDSFQSAPKWLHPGVVGMFAAVLLYCGVPLFFASVQAIHGQSFRKLLICLAVFIGLLFWQGIIMLPWIVLILWFCAVDEVQGLLWKLRGPFTFPVAAAAFIIPAAYAFFYFRLVELFNMSNGNELIQITVSGSMQTLPLTRFWGTVLLMASSVLIIALIVKILMGFLESADIRRGMIFGCMICLSWALLTGMWNAGGFDRIGDRPSAPHLFNTVNILNGSYTSYTDMALFEFVEETIAKHGDAKNTRFGLNLITDDPMLDWYFRLYPGIQTVVNENADLTGIELILDRSDSSRESQGFTGVRLTNWRGTMDWRRLTLQEWGKWLLFGDAKLTEETPVTLWVKADYIYSSEN